MGMVMTCILYKRIMLCMDVRQHASILLYGCNNYELTEARSGRTHAQRQRTYLSYIIVMPGVRPCSRIYCLSTFMLTPARYDCVLTTYLYTAARTCTCKYVNLYVVQIYIICVYHHSITVILICIYLLVLLRCLRL